MIDIFDFSPQQLAMLFDSWGELPFRAEQAIEAVWREHFTDFSEISSLPKKLRDRMNQSFLIPTPLVPKSIEQDIDGTIKAVFRLTDAQFIETVAIPKDDRLTFCLSTQVGCAMGCRFCATAQLGLIRHLSAGEIIAQIRGLSAYLGKMPTNMVFMGMGEPMHNIEAVRSVLEQITHPKAWNWSNNKSVVSTCGYLPGLESIINKPLRAKLALSLNAPDNQIRNLIMPINHKYPMEKVLSMVHQYSQLTGEPANIEYILFANLNDQLHHAQILCRLLKNHNVKVNLISFNPVKGLNFSAPKPDQVKRFMREMQKHNILTTFRTSRGIKIKAACGQLAGQMMRASE